MRLLAVRCHLNTPLSTELGAFLTAITKHLRRRKFKRGRAEQSGSQFKGPIFRHGGEEMSGMVGRHDARNRSPAEVKKGKSFIKSIKQNPVFLGKGANY